MRAILAGRTSTICGWGSGMRLRASEPLVLLLFVLPCPAAVFSFHVAGNDAGSWPSLLGSMGLVRGAAADAGVIVIPSSARAPLGDWAARVDHGAILIVEGDSPVAAAFGFRATPGKVAVRAVEDAHASKLGIVWEHALD